MFVDLVKPCAGCPFRKDGTGVHLNEGRIVELHRTVGQGIGFACHKTVHYDREDDEGRTLPLDGTEQHCAGALMYALNVGDPIARDVVQIRTAHKDGMFERLDAARAAEVFDSIEEFKEKGGC